MALSSADLSTVLGLVVGSGLPGSSAGRLAIAPEQESMLLALAATERVTGLVVTAVERGDLQLAEEHRTHLLDAHRYALRLSLAAESSAVEAIRVLTGAGLRARLLKGVAVTHLDYHDPAERNFVDADLLIEPAAFPVALGALTDAGFTRAELPLRGWWERRYGRAATLHASSGVELDVHARLATGYFGMRLDHALVWAGEGTRFVLGGERVEALAPDARLLHACFNVVLGRQSGLRAKRDVAQLLLVSGASLDQARALARHADAEAVLAQAIRRTWGALGLDPEHPASRWSSEVEPQGRAGRALAYAEAGEHHGWSADARSTMLALGPLDRVRFLGGVAWPSRQNRAARGRSLGDHLTRLTRPGRRT